VERAQITGVQVLGGSQHAEGRDGRVEVLVQRQGQRPRRIEEGLLGSGVLLALGLVQGNRGEGEKRNERAGHEQGEPSTKPHHALASLAKTARRTVGSRKGAVSP
jgi:hypothetical protein